MKEGVVMIKYITLALALATTSVFAASTVADMSDVKAASQNKRGFNGQIGLGVANLPKYVGGDDTETIAIPLINVNYNDRIYFNFNKLGGWLYKSNNGFRVGGLITIHQGYDAKDVPDKYNWVGDREHSVMAGLNVAYNQGRLSTEAGYLTDVSDESEGTKFYVQASYTFLANATYTFTAMGKIEHQDEDLVNYYYGVNDSGTNASIGLIGTYKLSQRWSLLGAVTVATLDDNIIDSPIVEGDSYSMALLGATYSF